MVDSGRSHIEMDDLGVFATSEVKVPSEATRLSGLASADTRLTQGPLFRPVVLLTMAYA